MPTPVPTYDMGNDAFRPTIPVHGGANNATNFAMDRWREATMDPSQGQGYGRGGRFGGPFGQGGRFGGPQMQYQQGMADMLRQQPSKGLGPQQYSAMPWQQKTYL